ncbi:MAG: response regulator [Archangiaceae bacterium]|nr:response regulator [Archangiaceae bacterium]
MKRVLIVDDEFGIVEALSDVLGEEGYAVSTARNGREALKRFGEVKPDLILVDYMMPVMDGLQFIAELRQIDTQCPVVLMTAVKRDQLPPALKVAEVLQKPFGVDQLLEVVQKLVG